MLTDKQRKRLAEEMRKLAYECAEGTAPPLITDQFYDGRGRHCVLGEVGHRHGLRDGDGGAFAELFFGWPWRASSEMAAIANNTARDKDRHGAVVFPLLALADAVEALAERSNG